MKVGVVGAGVIGRSVAHALLEAGHEVILADEDPDAITFAPTHIRSSMQMFRLNSREELAPLGDLLERLSPTTDLNEIAGANVVIENVVENMDVKIEVHRRLQMLCSSDCAIAMNTSAIPVHVVAAVYEDPSMVIGVHFMNPVIMIDTVEVIRGMFTSRRTIEQIEKLLRSMGKRGVVVGDRTGFVINRVLMLAINEASKVVAERTATPSEVDLLFTGCLGHEMGPLHTADLIGIDTVVLTLEELRADYGSAYEPSPILLEMREQATLGRKSGRGFFSYPASAAR